MITLVNDIGSFPILSNVNKTFFNRAYNFISIKTPNSSKMVNGYERTAGVSVTATIKTSNSSSFVEKQKISSDLTITIARIRE